MAAPDGQAVEVPALPGSTVATDEKSAEGTSSITGVVLDATTGLPAVGALVSLARGVAAPVLKGAVCDSRGRFVFTRLPASADYTLTASGSSYVESPYSPDAVGDGPPRRPVEISLAPKEWRRDIVIRLWRLGEISGYVLDESGDPLVGVTVRAFSPTTLHSRTYLGGSALGTTDDRGRYRLTALRSGSYIVGIIASQATVPDGIPEVPQRRAIGALISAGLPDSDGPAISGPILLARTGHRLAVNSLALNSSDGESRAYRAVFYPSALSPDGAQRVTVANGEQRDGVTFRLEPVRTFRVSGAVPPGVRTDGAPLLRLLPRGFEELGLGNEVATTLLEPSGSFTFLGVPPGQYVLVAHSGGMEFVNQTVTTRIPDPPGFTSDSIGIGSFPGMPDLAILERTGPPASTWGRMPVDVVDADVVGISLALKPTLSIRGRVELETGATLPRPQSPLFVTAEPANGNPSLGMRRAAADRSGPTNSFSIDGLQPGTYLLRGSYFPIRSITWRGRDVTDAGIDISAGDDADGVIITLTPQATELSGSVANGDPRGGAVVIAFPVDPTLWSHYGWIPRRLRSVRVRADGTYAFRNLPPGEYCVVAVEPVLADAWTDPLFLKAASSVASKTRLEWGSRTNLDLSVKPGIRK